MIKKMSLKKILVCFIALFSLSIIYFLPNDKLDTKQEIKYVNNFVNTEIVYLENDDHYLTRVNVEIKNNDIQKKAKDLLQTLIIDKNNNLPTGFTGVIPSNTKINSLTYKDSVIKVDFSKDLMNTKAKNEEKIIESIVYTLTDIEEVKYVIIYIEGELLTELPKSKIILPSTLDRSFGINKNYHITDDRNITKTTIYYVSNYNNQDYYVPVTKVNNDTRDKIEIIIEELSNNLYQDNLKSYLNNNTKLVSSKIEDNNISLVFNDYILDSDENQDILDEVIYTICLSINDNYSADNVSFNTENKEIKKTVLKSLE